MIWVIFIFQKRCAEHPVYSVASWVLQEVKIETCWWPQHSVADWFISLHFFARHCCVAGSTLYIIRYMHRPLWDIQRSSKRSGWVANAKWLAKQKPQSYSWRKPAWWRSPCMTKVWERFGPCIGEFKESDAITACPQSGGTLYVLRTWRLKSVSRTVLAEDVAQLEPMHPASHTVLYRIPGDAITGNGEWHKVYGFLDGYLKAFPCPQEVQKTTSP